MKRYLLNEVLEDTIRSYLKQLSIAAVFERYSDSQDVLDLKTSSKYQKIFVSSSKNFINEVVIEITDCNLKYLIEKDYLFDFRKHCWFVEAVYLTKKDIKTISDLIKNDNVEYWELKQIFYDTFEGITLFILDNIIYHFEDLEKIFENCNQ